jgi:Ca2+-binding RTX toxin-like protein
LSDPGSDASLVGWSASADAYYEEAAVHAVRRKGSSLIALLMLIGASLTVMMPVASAAKPKCFGRTATHVGTGGDNEINGTAGNDVIVAKGGNDSIRSGKGNDYICAGGGGFDVIFSGAGNDKISGEGGDDVVFPGPGSDLADGGSGGNYITYEGTVVSIVAYLGTGTIDSGGDVDEISNFDGVGGSEAGDLLIGNDEDNSLSGNGGDDELRGLGGSDFLSTGAGDDTAAGGDGADLLDLLTAYGGPSLGDDIFAVSGADVNLADGTVDGGSDVGTDAVSGFEAVGGTLGDDSLTGDDHSNRLVAFSGDDELDGAGADDSLEPGTGDDTLDGGGGSDLADFFSAGPFEGLLGPIDVDLAAGTMTSETMGSDTLTDMEGAAGTIYDDTMSGTDGPDLFTADDGSDSVTGGEGDDYLDGDSFFFGFDVDYSGPDTLHGDGGTDTCLGGDTVDGCEVTEPSAGRWSTLKRYAKLARTPWPQLR